jgi:hypothetical protein
VAPTPGAAEGTDMESAPAPIGDEVEGSRVVKTTVEDPASTSQMEADRGDIAAAQDGEGADIKPPTFSGGVDTAEPEQASNSAAADPNEPGDAPRATRSKTAPFRKVPTPPPSSPSPAPQITRGVLTLSDVHAARDALAEKANSHWVKGLGGGQNKEGETIVNFLYKMKVGPGEW